MSITQIQTKFPWIKPESTPDELYWPAIEIAKRGTIRSHYEYFEALKYFHIHTTPNLSSAWQDRQAFVLAEATEIVRRKLYEYARTKEAGAAHLVATTYGTCKN